MPKFLEHLLDTADFPARWHCGRWTDLHGWTHVASDLAIFGAYAAIPITLVVLIRRRSDLPFSPLFWLFSLFIFSCGLNHLIEATIFWRPWYRLSAVVKVVTALASWATVVVLAQKLPLALALPGLTTVNKQLASEVAVRTALEARFRGTFENAAVGIAHVARDGRWLRVNQAFCGITGYSRDEILEKTFADVTHPDDIERDWAQAKRLLAGEIDQYTLDKRYIRPDGTVVWISLSVSMVRDAPDQEPYFISIIQNITARKEAEAEHQRLVRLVEQSRDELEDRVRSRTSELARALQEREVLLKEIHHRVKNNLQVVCSLINMQAQVVQDPQSRSALDECRTRIQAIAMIHEQLYQSPDLARVSFSDYAKNLVNNVFKTAGLSSNDVTLGVVVEDVALAVDRAIPCGLVLNELISNALKHAFVGRPRGKLSVRFERVGEGKLRLVVEDDGVGLPVGFDVRQSSSLGLQLVSILATQLDADLEIDGGEGARFQLTFAE